MDPHESKPDLEGLNIKSLLHIFTKLSSDSQRPNVDGFEKKKLDANIIHNCNILIMSTIVPECKVLSHGNPHYYNVIFITKLSEFFSGCIIDDIKYFQIDDTKRIQNIQNRSYICVYL